MKTICYLIVAVAFDSVWLACLLWSWFVCHDYSTVGILLAWAACGVLTDRIGRRMR